MQSVYTSTFAPLLLLLLLSHFSRVRLCATPETAVHQASLSFKNECDINCSNTLLGQVHKAKEIKPKINKWNLIKFISFF